MAKDQKQFEENLKLRTEPVEKRTYEKKAIDILLAYQALKLCYENNRVSYSFLQRKLSRGYNTIAGILDFWQEEGYIRVNSDGTRELVRPYEEFMQEYKKYFGEYAEKVEPDKAKEKENGMSDFEVSAWRALKICYDDKRISCSYLQRKMSRGYNTIALILDYWQEEGYVSAQPAKGKRTFLRPPEEFYAEYHKRFGEDSQDSFSAPIRVRTID